MDIIYFGVGSLPKLQASLLNPFTCIDPTVCEAGLQAVFQALDALTESGVSATQDGKKPLLIVYSSTGINARTRDLPLAYIPLYKWLASIPHADKKRMELLAMNDGGEHVRDFVVVRPTMLTDAEPLGIENVRAGWEWAGERRGDEPGPQIGWTIGRKDVGEWVFRNVVVEGSWEGKCVSLTT